MALRGFAVFAGVFEGILGKVVFRDGFFVDRVWWTVWIRRFVNVRFSGGDFLQIFEIYFWEGIASSQSDGTRKLPDNPKVASSDSPCFRPWWNC